MYSLNKYYLKELIKDYETHFKDVNYAMSRIGLLDDDIDNYVFANSAKYGLICLVKNIEDYLNLVKDTLGLVLVSSNCPLEILGLYALKPGLAHKDFVMKVLCNSKFGYLNLNQINDTESLDALDFYYEFFDLFEEHLNFMKSLV